MTISAWLYFFKEVPSHIRSNVQKALDQPDLILNAVTAPSHGFGVVVFDWMNDSHLRELRALTCDSTVLAISISPHGLDSSQMWSVLDAGIADLLLWPRLPASADQVISRLQRWDSVQK